MRRTGPKPRRRRGDQADQGADQGNCFFCGQMHGYHPFTAGDMIISQRRAHADMQPKDHA